MTDRPAPPIPTPVRTAGDIAPKSTNRLRRFIAALDKPLVFIVGLLLAIGMMMVYSTTFDWSLAARGTPTAIFLQDHMRNVILALIAATFFAVIDYRFWRRFAVLVLLVTIGALVAVLAFGDDTFNARRALINGRFQPGELAEFAVVFYMAAWLSSKNTKVGSIAYGLIPFLVLVGIIAGLVAWQPDLSSAGIIVLTAGIMFFIAGANIIHLGILGALLAAAGAVIIQVFPYVSERLLTYNASLVDLTKANYHTQQAIIAFVNGGWLGVGLGESKQKFGFLPAPHTDSIFAIIGEELGVIGAAFVVTLFIALAVRGYQIARRAVDPFGALLAVGFTTWIIIRALLNIAVMTAIVPSTGVPLPFISYGGSALMVVMMSVGLMLSIQRVATLRQTTERRSNLADYDRGWGDRRTRLSRARRR